MYASKKNKTISKQKNSTTKHMCYKYIEINKCLYKYVQTFNKQVCLLEAELIIQEHRIVIIFFIDWMGMNDSF